MPITQLFGCCGAVTEADEKTLRAAAI